MTEMGGLAEISFISVYYVPRHDIYSRLWPRGSDADVQPEPLDAAERVCLGDLQSTCREHLVRSWGVRSPGGTRRRGQPAKTVGHE